MAHNGGWSISGKTCLVTGANCGIGYATVLNLAKRGAGRVIMACRNVEAGEKAAEEIRSQLKSEESGAENAAGGSGSSNKRTVTELFVRHIDLASLESVKKFADEFLATEQRLDVLVNNAAVLQKGKLAQLSEDGFEITFATNFLGPFLLTTMLLELMQKSAPARIVMVSSQAYQAAWPHGYDLSDVNQTEYMRQHGGDFSYWRAYSQSKLAIILFSRALHRRLVEADACNNNKTKKAKPGVSIFSLHPGEIRTNITRHHPSKLNFINVWWRLFGKDPKNGGEVPVYCACEPGLERFSGKYFGKHCKVESLFAMAKDDAIADQLFEQATEWTRKVFITVAE